MPKFMYTASYTAEGVKGLLRDGAEARVKAAETLVASLGGKIESFYFCIGQDDVVAIADLPDNSAAAALSATIAATGAVRGCVTPLLTISEMDKALQCRTTYRAPGQ
jgi:uncharacterized protein with GYD domain